MLFAVMLSHLGQISIIEATRAGWGLGKGRVIHSTSTTLVTSHLLSVMRAAEDCYSGKDHGTGKLPRGKYRQEIQ